MKGIECAFTGKVENAELRTSAKTGRQWLSMIVIEGEGADTQQVSVAAFFGHIEELAAIPQGTRVYVEGKAKIRTWEDNSGYLRACLSVSAALIQPLGLIGERRPKRTRTPRTVSEKSRPPDPQAPIEFNDELPI